MHRRRREGVLSEGPRPQDCPRPRTSDLHAVGAQPGSKHRDRWQEHRLCAQLWITVRHRPRQRPPIRHDRGLQERREACVHAPAHAHEWRNGVRTRRCAGQQTSPRHGPRTSQVQRQGIDGFGHGTRACGRLDRTLPDGLWRRHRGQDGHDQSDQRELSARLGCNHARRSRGVCPQQPGVHHFALHLDGCHVSREPCRARRSGACRSPLRDGLRPVGEPGSTGHLRYFCHLDVDGDRSPDIWYTRGWPGDLCHGRTRPPRRCAISFRWPIHRVEIPRRPGRI